MPVVITGLFLIAAALAAIPALFEVRLLARFLRYRDRIRAAGRRDRRVPGDDALPTVTIQIPLYNERTAAEQVIRAAVAQDYPGDRFDIQILDDSTDETPEIVARVLASLADSGVRIRHLRRERRVGFKAGALAAGLEESAAEFVAMFDADFAPEPSFLRRILVTETPFDDPELAFVQARWSWNGSEVSLFHSAIALLMDRHFFIQKPTRELMGNVATFNGSAGIWRRKAIDAVGGWSADTLTEDLDLSYRCALAGWKGRYLRDVAVPSELPGDMRAFKLQQHRWARGNAQCMRKLTGRVLHSPGVIREKWEEAHYLAGYAVHPIMLANLLLWPWAVLAMDRGLFFTIQLLLLVFNVVAPASFLIVLRERGDALTPAGALRVAAGVCVGIGMMVVNTVGQVQGFLSARGEFNRTPKGARKATGELAQLGAARPYGIALHWTFFLELLVIGYCVAGADLLAQRGEAIWMTPLLVWGFCLSMVVLLQCMPGDGRAPEHEPAPVTA
jgi:cellulose synthase/poly-beta-1,6-N-acetylglucosamine synthase-like glycosyltransferase